MTIREIYSYCINELNKNDEKYVDTELLLSHILKKNRLYIKLNLGEEISVEEEIEIKNSIYKLKNNMPIHYIIGKRDFYGYQFYVSENVLIPRSDTEILVEESINTLKNFNSKNIITGLEIGVGSGIISISLLKNISNLKMTSVDINESAISLTKKNAVNLEVKDRINIIKSNLYENIHGKFDFIISNPPYIKTSDIENLSDKIKFYEPLNALDGKYNGLYFYDEILKNAKKYLKEEFCIFFEIGYNQGKDITNLFKKYGFGEKVNIIKDYSGYDRTVVYKNSL